MAEIPGFGILTLQFLVIIVVVLVVVSSLFRCLGRQFQRSVVS